MQDSNRLEQIQERLSMYGENWRSINRWCSRFKIVCTINSMMDIQSVCNVTAEKVQEAINIVSPHLKSLSLTKMLLLYRINKLKQ